MGVGGCETKTIGYTCRSVGPKVFGPGFNPPRPHQTSPLGYLTEGAHVFGREFPGNPGHRRRSAGALGHLYGCLELSSVGGEALAICMNGLRTRTTMCST